MGQGETGKRRGEMGEEEEESSYYHDTNKSALHPRIFFRSSGRLRRPLTVSLNRVEFPGQGRAVVRGWNSYFALGYPG